MAPEQAGLVACRSHLAFPTYLPASQGHRRGGPSHPHVYVPTAYLCTQNGLNSMDETDEHVCACVRVRALLEDVKLGGKSTRVPHQNPHRPALLQHTTAKSKTVTCPNQSEHFKCLYPTFCVGGRGGNLWLSSSIHVTLTNTKQRWRVWRGYIPWKGMERSCWAISRLNIQQSLNQANYNLKSSTVYCSKNTLLVCFLQSCFCVWAFIHPLFKYPGKDKPYNKAGFLGQE